MMNGKRFFLTALTAICVLALAGPATAEITSVKDSADFGTYKYEMNAKPSAEDLDPLVDPDGDSVVLDFNEVRSGATGTLSNGILNLSSTDSQYLLYWSNFDDGAWRTLAPTLATGYTVEIKLRVNSQTDDTNGAIAIYSTASDSNADGFLKIGTDFVKWGTISLSGASNSTGFHTFRIAMEENQATGSEKFTVWRDRVKLSSTLTDATGDNGLNEVYFGDPGVGGGNVDVDYFRFTSGAYAPVPEPSSLVLLAMGLAGLFVIRRRQK